MAKVTCYACARLKEASTWAGFSASVGLVIPMLDHGALRNGMIVAGLLCALLAVFFKGGAGDDKPAA